MTSRRLSLFLALLAVNYPLGAGEPRPTQEELNEITKRGVLLFQLDEAAANSTDALRRQGLSIPPGGLYICYEQPAGVHCAYGVLEEGAKLFNVEYLVVATGVETEIVGQKPTRRQRRWLASAAKAIWNAAEVFPFDSNAEAYNHIVVPESSGEISVYFYPSTTRSNVRVMGADGRVTVQADGTAELQQFHSNLLEFEAPQDGSELVSGAHSHVMSSVPSPLDVLYVLKPPNVTEYILGETWAFEVDKSAAIRCLGTTKEFVVEVQRLLEEDKDAN